VDIPFRKDLICSTLTEFGSDAVCATTSMTAASADWSWQHFSRKIFSGTQNSTRTVLLKWDRSLKRFQLWIQFIYVLYVTFTYTTARKSLN
jgi:hypothetical protein